MSKPQDRLRSKSLARSNSANTGAGSAAARALAQGTLKTVPGELLKAPVPVVAVPGAAPQLRVPGLHAVLPLPATAGTVIKVPLDQLVEGKENWRVFFDSKKLEELEAEMRRDGQLEPVQAFLRQDGKYELVGGHRRLRAARQIPLPYLDVLVIVEPESAQHRARLSRNLNGARADTTVLDDAIRWREALDKGEFESQQALAEFFSVPPSRISKTITIASIPRVVLEAVAGCSAWQKLGKLYPLAQLHALWMQQGLDATGRALKLVRDHEEALSEEKLIEKVEEAKGKPGGKGAPTRATPARVLLSCPAGGSGTLKLFEAERKLELELKGVPLDVLKLLYDEVGKVVQARLNAVRESEASAKQPQQPVMQ
jgi:ParB/RepB/Spo0J family partition protein